MKENVLSLKKVRGRRYLAETITDLAYVDDVVLLVNTSS